MLHRHLRFLSEPSSPAVSLLAVKDMPVVILIVQDLLVYFFYKADTQFCIRTSYFGQICRLHFRCPWWILNTTFCSPHWSSVKFRGNLSLDFNDAKAIDGHESQRVKLAVLFKWVRRHTLYHSSITDKKPSVGISNQVKSSQVNFYCIFNYIPRCYIQHWDEELQKAHLFNKEKKIICELIYAEEGSSLLWVCYTVLM